MGFNRSVLRIDARGEAGRLADFIRGQAREMRRDGIVLGLSGGVDSAVCAALAVRAVGPGRVRGLILPERESDPASERLARAQADRLGMSADVLDITAVLESFGAYRRRDEGIRSVFADFAGGRARMVLPPDLLARDAYNIPSFEVEDGAGARRSRRATPDALRAVVAATNAKLRVRMIFLYYHAERDNALVCGTTNRTEALQGFFVKYGDGGVDIEPIAHLFKVQVYQLARALPVLPEIIEREPTPDTFGLPVSDQEFYFRIPYATLDPLLFAWENDMPAEETAAGMGLTEDQVRRAFRDFGAKFRATRHLRAMPPSPAKDAS